MGIRETCIICNNEASEFLGSEGGEIVYLICPNCGRYIFPHSSMYLIDEKYLGKDVDMFDTSKLAKYLFHNKIENRNAFIGTQKSFDEYKKLKPNSEAFLVSPNMVEDWYPNTYEQKIKRALCWIASHSSYRGEAVTISTEDIESVFFLENSYYERYKKVCSRSWLRELAFLYNYLNDKDLLQNKLTEGEMHYLIEGLKDPPYPWALIFTLSPKAYQMVENFKPNKNVFVAMKFGTETLALREKIKEGLVGYNVRIMDEIEHNHLIVPEMLKEIKNSGFVIAELSNHNNGAYYEAGYALGLGKEVIHICQKDELSNGLHFDVAQVNTIVYENIDEIPEKLKRRIQATIK